MEYPHYPYHRFSEEEKEEGFFKARKFKPKMLIYFLVMVAAAVHYFIGFGAFYYISLGFLAYAGFKLVSCGCWKSQIRTVAALSFFALASGFGSQVFFSVGVSIMAFEMFI